MRWQTWRTARREGYRPGLDSRMLDCSLSEPLQIF
jgi:hypothetical protein